MCLLALQAGAQSYSKENTITKTFPVYDDIEIEVSNKYGNISIENWDTDSVKFVIHYKVTSNKESKLARNFESLDFDFNANQFYIVANTVFDAKGSFWSDVSDIAENLFAAGTNTSIDYTIYMPQSLNLKLTLKYGNIYLADYHGTLNINLSNGNLKAHDLTGNTEITTSFGDVTLNKITEGKLTINYGNLSIENAHKIDLISNSSEIEISNADIININSRRDKIWIDKAQGINGETYFTKSIIENITSNISLSTKYGSIKIRNIEHSAKEINITSINTSVNTYLNTDDTYKIDILSDDKADVSVSTDIGKFTTSIINKDGYVHQANCIYGENNNPTDIMLKVKSGLLSIKLK